MISADPAVGALLQALLEDVRSILGKNFIGMYLYGSLAGGDFDAASDIDVLVVSGEELNPQEFDALQAMHAAIFARRSYWETQLEVCYLPRRAVRRYDPADARHPYLDRGSAQMEWMEYGQSWIVQLYVLRQRGIVLAGPPLTELIDPLTPDDLRRTMVGLLRDWAGRLNANSPEFASRGYQSYVVLTQCRILYTLRFGEVVSKIFAARWALGWLEPRWARLVERALADRQDPDGAPQPEVVQETLDFIRYIGVIGDTRL